MLLQKIGDTEGVAELVEALGIKGYLSPEAEGFALRVGVGEDDDAVLKQGLQELGLEGLETTAGEPDEIGEFLGEDHRGFLGLHNGYFRDHG